MKNKWFYLSALRSIKKQKISFISIVLMLVLGVSVFIGADFGALSIKDALSEYFVESSYRDIEVISPLLLNDDDLTRIKSIEGVQEVEGNYQVPVEVSVGNISVDVRVVSNSALFNKVNLVEGNIPWEDDECLVEKKLADKLNLKIGDIIYPRDESVFNIKSIYSEEEESEGFLNYSEYEITGIVECPENIDPKYEYVSYIFVNKGGFDSTVLSESYMGAHIKMETEDGESVYSDSYLKKLDTVCERLAEISKEAYQRRFNELNDMYFDYLDSYESYFERNPDAYEKMQQMGEMLEEYRDGDWIITTIPENVGYKIVGNNSDMIKKLGPTFTSVFLITAIVMICVLIWKMLNEDRAVIGDMMASGFKDREIFMPYFVYGISAVLLGCIGGIAVGVLMLEAIINYQYARFYLFEIPLFNIYPLRAVGIVVVLTAIAFTAIFIFVGNIRKKPVTALMGKEKGGYGNRKVLKSRQRVFSFSRISLRDMKTDLHRIVLSVISVTGAVAIVIMSFSIRFGIGNTVEYQKNEIINYAGELWFDEDEDVERKIEGLMSERGIDYLPTSREYAIIKGDKISTIVELRTVDLKELQEYRKVTDAETGENITDADGFCISEKFAEGLNLKTGDTVYIQNSLGNVYEAEISHIFTNYIGLETFMSQEYYEEIFGKEAGTNILMIKDEPDEALVSELENTEGYGGFETYDDKTAYLTGYFAAFSLIIIVITGFAIAMGSVLVPAIVDMQMTEKRREINVMRMVGFFDGEIRKYLRFEALITCICGIAAGVVFGYFMSVYTLHLIGGVYASYITTPSVWNIVIPVAVMAVFYVVIYRISLTYILRKRG